MVQVLCAFSMELPSFEICVNGYPRFETTYYPHPQGPLIPRRSIYYPARFRTQRDLETSIGHTDAGSYPQLHRSENFNTRKHFQLNILESRTDSCFTFQALHAPNVFWTLPSAHNGENRSGQTGSPSSSCLKLSAEPSLTDAWSWRTDIALMSHSRVGVEGAGQI